jgi:hypothetical protein
VLNLANVSGASKTYEMLLAVQVALTTEDGYLILQRRSDVVQTERRAGIERRRFRTLDGPQAPEVVTD